MNTDMLTFDFTVRWSIPAFLSAVSLFSGSLGGSLTTGTGAGGGGTGAGLGGQVSGVTYDPLPRTTNSFSTNSFVSETQIKVLQVILVN